MAEVEEVSTLQVDHIDWGNDMLINLYPLWKENILCDTTIVCANDETLEAHSILLAAASPSLYSFFRNSEQGTYIFRCTAVPLYVWKNCVTFIYTGRLDIPKEQLVPTYNLANKLAMFNFSKELASRLKLHGMVKGGNMKIQGNKMQAKTNIGKEEKEKVDKHGKVDDEVEMSDINKLDEEAEDSNSEQITDIQQNIDLQSYGTNKKDKKDKDKENTLPEDTLVKDLPEIKSSPEGKAAAAAKRRGRRSTTGTRSSVSSTEGSKKSPVRAPVKSAVKSSSGDRSTGGKRKEKVVVASEASTSALDSSASGCEDQNNTEHYDMPDMDTDTTLSPTTQDNTSVSPASVTVNKDKGYDCPHCSMPFKRNSALKKHLKQCKSKHKWMQSEIKANSNKPFKKATVGRNDMRHMYSKRSDNQYTCNVCNTLVKTYQGVYLHIKNKHLGKKNKRAEYSEPDHDTATTSETAVETGSMIHFSLPQSPPPLRLLIPPQLPTTTTPVNIQPYQQTPPLPQQNPSPPPSQGDQSKVTVTKIQPATMVSNLKKEKEDKVDDTLSDLPVGVREHCVVNTHPYYKFKCRTCGKIFKNIPTFIMHVKMHHSGTKLRVVGSDKSVVAAPLVGGPVLPKIPLPPSPPKPSSSSSSSSSNHTRFEFTDEQKSQDGTAVYTTSTIINKTSSEAIPMIESQPVVGPKIPKIPLPPPPPPTLEQQPQMEFAPNIPTVVQSFTHDLTSAVRVSDPITLTVPPVPTLTQAQASNSNITMITAIPKHSSSSSAISSPTSSAPANSSSSGSGSSTNIIIPPPGIMISDDPKVHSFGSSDAVDLRPKVYSRTTTEQQQFSSISTVTPINISMASNINTSNNTTIDTKPSIKTETTTNIQSPSISQVSPRLRMSTTSSSPSSLSEGTIITKMEKESVAAVHPLAVARISTIESEGGEGGGIRFLAPYQSSDEMGTSPESAPPEFICSLCDRVFSKKMNLANHMRVHSPGYAPDKHKRK